MKSTRRVRNLARFASVGVCAAMLLAFVAPNASAAPPPLATANAAHTAGLLNLTTGTCNFPSAPGDICSTPGTGNMGSVLSAAVLTQAAGSNATGPFACAGASGPGGGLVNIGPAGPCPSLATVSANPPTTSGGVVVLGGLEVAKVAYATCQGTSTGVNGGSVVLGIPALLGSGTGSLANLLNLNLGTLLSGLGLGTVQITGNLNPGTSPSTVTVNLVPLLGTSTPLLKLLLNQTTTSGGATTFTAFELQVLPGFQNLAGSVPAIGNLLTSLLGLSLNTFTTSTTLLDVVVGQATCSPTPPTPPTNLIPLKGAPIAAGMLLVAGFLGWRLWWTPRQRARSVTV